MDAQAKRLKTAHRVSATFSHTHTHTHTQIHTKHPGRKQYYLNWHPYLWPPVPHPLSKGNTAEVSECQRARICFTFPKCHGIWAACTNEMRRGVAARRERTWVKRRRWQGVFSTRWLIAVFMQLAAGSLNNGWRNGLRTIALTLVWLHVWLRRGACWMKLQLKIFTRCDIVSIPCKTNPPRYCHVQITTRINKHGMEGSAGAAPSTCMWCRAACTKHTRTYASRCSQEVVSVPCHLSSLVMAARLLG